MPSSIALISEGMVLAAYNLCKIPKSSERASQVLEDSDHVVFVIVDEAPLRVKVMHYLL